MKIFVKSFINLFLQGTKDRRHLHCHSDFDGKEKSISVKKIEENFVKTNLKSREKNYSGFVVGKKIASEQKK